MMEALTRRKIYVPAVQRQSEGEACVTHSSKYSELENALAPQCKLCIPLPLNSRVGGR